MNCKVLFYSTKGLYDSVQRCLVTAPHENPDQPDENVCVMEWREGRWIPFLQDDMRYIAIAALVDWVEKEWQKYLATIIVCNTDLQ
jgi:hypothetical protein